MTDYELIRPVAGPPTWRENTGNAARIQLSDQEIQEILELMDATEAFQREAAGGDYTEITIDKSFQLLLGDMPPSRDPRRTTDAQDQRLFQQPQPLDSISLQDEGWESMKTRLWPDQIAWYDVYFDSEGGNYELFVEVVQRKDLLLVQMMRVEGKRQEQLFQQIARATSQTDLERLVWAALRGAGQRRSYKKLLDLEEAAETTWETDTRMLLEITLLEDRTRARQSWTNLCQNFPERAARSLEHPRVQNLLDRHDMRPLLEHDSQTVRRQALRTLGRDQPPAAPDTNAQHTRSR